MELSMLSLNKRKEIISPFLYRVPKQLLTTFDRSKIKIFYLKLKKRKLNVQLYKIWMVACRSSDPIRPSSKLNKILVKIIAYLGQITYFYKFTLNFTIIACSTGTFFGTGILVLDFMGPGILVPKNCRDPGIASYIYNQQRVKN
jgi:hypothetical protein